MWKRGSTTHLHIRGKTVWQLNHRKTLLVENGRLMRVQLYFARRHTRYLATQLVRPHLNYSSRHHTQPPATSMTMRLGPTQRQFFKWGRGKIKGLYGKRKLPALFLWPRKTEIREPYGSASTPRRCRVLLPMQPRASARSPQLHTFEKDEQTKNKNRRLETMFSGIPNTTSHYQWPWQHSIAWRCSLRYSGEIRLSRIR